jgi:hypothetical protein
MRLIGGAVSARVRVDRDREPRPICLGIAKLRFSLDVGEAVELARQLVAAVDDAQAELRTRDTEPSNNVQGVSDDE